MASSERCERLLAWFKQNGGNMNEDIALVEDDKYGVHAVVVKDLHEPIDICVCPATLTLSHLNIPRDNKQNVPSSSVRTEDDTPLKALVGLIEPHVLSYAFLMEQKLLGEGSFWQPYIECLPTEQELGTPLCFTQEELEWVLGTNLHSSATDPNRSSVELRRAQWRGEWQGMCDVLMKEGVDVAGYTWELYLWAATIYTSRSFSSSVAFPQSPGFSLLYPVLDSLNHKFATKAVWAFSSGTFSLKVDESVNQGEQVFNNYAPKGNEELLMGYGFALENNPCDQVSVRLGRPPDPVVVQLRERFPHHFMDTWGPAQGTFFLRGTGHYSGGYDHSLPGLRGVPVEMFFMIAEMVYFMSTGDESGMGELDVDSPQYGDVVEEILFPLQQKLSMITTPAQALERAPASVREGMAKLYRDGQILILEGIIGEMQTFLSSRGEDGV